MQDKKNIVDIINNIFAMDRHDLEKIIEAVKLRRNQLHNQQAKALMVGTRVKFQGNHGKILTGTVIKVKIKKVLVDCTNGEKWNVPAGFVTPLTVEEITA